jgi:hypothetical protein
MNKILEIVTAWAVAISPTESQRKLAEERYNICVKCKYRGKNSFDNEICNVCGCLLSKKIFTLNLNNACPLDEWEIVDANYRKN